MAKRKLVGNPVEHSRVRQIIENLEVIDIRLMRCDCAQMFKEEELPDSLETGLEVQGQFDKKQGAILMLHGMRMVGSYQSKPSEKRPPLLIEVVFGARYQLDGKHQVTDRDLEAFGRTVSMFHVWPYWREFVRDITARMGLPPLTVPIFRIPGVGTKKKQARATKKLQRKKKGK
jgi:preprotein translocase subunit SecB